MHRVSRIRILLFVVNYACTVARAGAIAFDADADDDEKGDPTPATTEEVMQHNITIVDLPNADDSTELAEADWDAKRVVRDVAYFIRAHKFQDYDRRYYKSLDEASSRLYEEFPNPPLRALHWEVRKHCHADFIECLKYLERIIKLTALRRQDDTVTVMKEQKWQLANNSEQILAVQRDCVMAQRHDNLTMTPFQGPIERFQWRTTASYYMCWYTMKGIEHLANFGESCDNHANCLDEYGPHNKDPRADDSKPFACALYSFCPDHCCPMKHIWSMKDCFQSRQNPCYAENSADYQIVVPRKVDSDGRFVSHEIPHHFKRSIYDARKSKVKEHPKTKDDVLHYCVQIGGEEHHIELYPNHRLLAPGAVVEDRYAGILDNSKKDPLDNLRLKRARDAACHYHGRVRNQTGISAISTCYGLTGYIRTKRSWYMIEPVLSRDFANEEGHPHIVYRKSPEEVRKDGQFLCNVTQNLAKVLAKRSASSYRRVSRKEREEAKSYTVELLVVLDKLLLNYHRQMDTENYVLTLFNIASGLFHDASLGVEMDLAIVRIIRLEEEDDEMNFAKNKDPESVMKRFQEWQRIMNPNDDAHPNHHDCAILLTRFDICVSHGLCGFTGMSTIAGTCDPLKGAAVIRDTGLQTGYHIAHHIGHTLGMSHDDHGDENCPGIIFHPNGHAVETTVMYPGNVYIPKKWSKCSQGYLKLYIEQGLASCLEDEPHDHNFPTMEMLPGVVYNGDMQCRLQYHQNVVQCDLGITCEALRCAIPGKGCVSLKKPPAEGTQCGEKRWCYQMKCLMIGERPGAVDGGWSSWSPWSRCSRTCGSGVASSTRKCNNPTPSNGGLYCSGDRKRHKICASNPCEIGAPSFRDVQCAEFNDWVFPEDGKIHRWRAYNLPENLKSSENPCALYCVSDAKLVTALRPKVVDGTTCYRGIRDICIGGVCREIPCDLNMESNAVEDVCGVCKGNSTSCTLKEGTMTFVAGSELKKLVAVPVDSRNIRVEETQPTKSRIVVQSKSSGTVLIDGNHLGMFEVPGSKAWLGMIRPKQEALNIPGPVTEDLTILVSPVENVTLKYSLGLKPKAPRVPDFSWDFVDWAPCTAACGPGEQIAKPRCVEKVGGLVDDMYCKHLAKPDVKVRPCNQAPCLPRWMIGDWQGCTPCTPGCKRTRAVKCVRPVGRGEQDIDIIPSNFCHGSKPRESDTCTRRKRRDEKVSLLESSSNDSDKSSNSEKCDTIAVQKSGDNEKNYKAGRALERVHLIIDNHDEKVGATASKIAKRSKATNAEEKDQKSINKGHFVIDREDIKNLTLTIILERDEDNNIVNFPKDFRPRPPANGTEFTLVGMDAVRYVQRIQEDLRESTSLLPI